MLVGFILHDVLAEIFESIVKAPWAPPNEEALQGILKVPMEFPWVDDSTSIACSHVCQHWREVSLATPSCWRTIVIRVSYPGDIIKAHTYIERALNRPINLILLDEGDRNGAVSDELVEFMVECIPIVPGLYVRFRQEGLIGHIINALDSVPILQRLTLWQMSSSEMRILGLKNEPVNFQQLFFRSCLNTAPILRSLRTRNVPYLHQEDKPLNLPLLEEYVFEDIFAYYRPLATYAPFLRSFAQVTSFTWLPQVCLSSIFTGKPINFEHLEYLELSIPAASTLFSPIALIQAPKLNTVCYHIEGVVKGPVHTSVRHLAEAFRHSIVQIKRFILAGFGLSPEGNYEMGQYLSYARFASILVQFDYVHSIELRNCVLICTPTWNKAWLERADEEWERIIDRDEEKQDEELDIAGLLVALVAERERMISTTPTYRFGPRKALSETFMPHIDSIIFTRCVFISPDGARDFADVLAFRQKAATDGLNEIRSLDSITLNGVDEVGAFDFITRLRNSETMQGVEFIVG